MNKVKEKAGIREGGVPVERRKEEWLENYPFTYEFVRVGEVHIDYDYQRPPVLATVAEIAKNWDVNALGDIVLSRRRNGEYWVVDGQQRILGTQKALGPEFKIWAKVYQDLPWEQEAKKFSALNSERTIPTTGYRYRGWYESGRPDVVQLVRMLDALGIPHRWSGKGRSGDHHFISWGTLHTLATKYGMEHATYIMALIKETWPEDGYALEAVMIRGMSLFVRRFGSHEVWNRKRIRARLSLKAPETIIKEAITLAGRSDRKRIAEQVCEVLVKTHDRKLAANRFTPKVDA